VYWTDYPFKELGDIPFTIAPIRPVIVKEWDRNKYVRVEVEGQEFEIKEGYIYTEPGRCGSVPGLKFPRTHISQY